jgi:hypothetical protein
MKEDARALGFEAALPSHLGREETVADSRLNVRGDNGKGVVG